MLRSMELWPEVPPIPRLLWPLARSVDDRRGTDVTEQHQHHQHHYLSNTDTPCHRC